MDDFLVSGNEDEARATGEQVTRGGTEERANVRLSDMYPFPVVCGLHMDSRPYMRSDINSLHDSIGWDGVRHGYIQSEPREVHRMNHTTTGLSERLGMYEISICSIDQ